MRKIFSALFFQSATAQYERAEYERAETSVMIYDFLDFWRTADVFAYQVRQSMKYHALLRANRFIDNYEIVREAARYYDDGWYDGTQDLGNCICVLPPFTLQFDEKASPKTNIDTLNHKLDCWIQESLN